MKLSPPTTAFEPAGDESAWTPAPPPRRRRPWPIRLLRHPFAWLVLIPSGIVAAYFYLVATPQYVSEARIVVRSRAEAPQPSLGSMIAATVGGGGGLAAIGEAHGVRDFLLSHDAVARAQDKVDLIAIWQREEADMIARLRHTEPERLTRYYNGMVSVQLDSLTGLLTLRVRAFRPDDARTVAVTLIDLSESLVNRLSERAREDALHVAREEVAIAERRVVASREALTRFREERQDLDSAGSVQAAVATIAGLETALTTAQAELRERMAFMRPDNPALQVTRNRIGALERQIEAERSRRTQGDGALAQQLAGFERLMLEREFADRQLASATASLEGARMEAQRQQMYLARVVEPNLAVYPLYPRKLISVGSIFLGLSVAFGVGWLLVAGMREHAA